MACKYHKNIVREDLKRKIPCDKQSLLWSYAEMYFMPEWLKKMCLAFLLLFSLKCAPSNWFKEGSLPVKGAK